MIDSVSIGFAIHLAFLAAMLPTYKSFVSRVKTVEAGKLASINPTLPIQTLLHLAIFIFIYFTFMFIVLTRRKAT